MPLQISAAVKFGEGSSACKQIFPETTFVAESNTVSEGNE